MGVALLCTIVVCATCQTAAAAAVTAAGNFCSSGDKGRQPGNGRLVVTKFNGKAAGAGCAWDYVKTINVPSEASFEDYSDIAVSRNQVRLPISTVIMLLCGLLLLTTTE
jgi:hypothetical protein